MIELDYAAVLMLKSCILLREDTKNFSFLVILPNEHSVVDKLILSRHLNLDHTEVQIMISNLREDFWILKFRKIIRKIFRAAYNAKCMILSQ